MNRASTREPNPERAVAELAAQIGQSARSGVIFFCSPKYDLERLGRALERTFPCPVIGCTSSGQIGPAGFQPEGITAASFASDALTIRPFLIQPLADHANVAAIGSQVHELRGSSPALRAFGLLLVDGLSLREERLVSTLYRTLGDIPIVGGSAGDDLSFERTHVYHEGRFLSDAACFALFETSLRFTPFMFHHFIPTSKKLVITEADPDRRIVHEIDGRPAAQAYAELIGVKVTDLNAQVFSRNPLMLKLDGEYFVRSVYKHNPDDSLTLLCAIEAGVVLTIGQSADAIAAAEHAFAKLEDRLAMPETIIGCDCVLRRLELEDTHLAGKIGEFFAHHRVIGFSTYGEQYNAMHINQTFTGVAIGSH